MAPPTATETVVHATETQAQHPPTSNEGQTHPKAVQSGAKAMKVPSMPKFESKEAEREHRKKKLCTAFRVLGSLGLNEGAPL